MFSLPKLLFHMTQILMERIFAIILFSAYIEKVLLFPLVKYIIIIFKTLHLPLAVVCKALFNLLLLFGHHISPWG